MPKDRSGNEPVAKTELATGDVLVRLGAIGAAMLVAAVAFAYVGGWLSPSRLTQDRMAAALQEANGSHPGFRLNHAKGLCASGWFDSNGQASPLSKAAVFEPGRVPLIGRFSLAGGMPFQTDKPGSVRALALRLIPTAAEEWRMGALNIPVFVVNSAQGFYDQTLASAPDPGTGKPDPARMNAFLAAHPEAVKALAIIKERPISTGFANSTFNGLNAFRFVSAAGASIPVRWSLVPVQAYVAEGAAPPAPADKNYLFDDLITQVTEHPLQWRLLVMVGQPGDPTNDATLPWPSDRQQIDAGTVTIDQVSSEATGRCADVNYDPLVLPSGIESSDDPLLSARSAVYARSFTLRAGAQREKPPSAITAHAVPAGGKP
jgi:catalase